MNKEDLTQLVTIKDLDVFGKKIIDELRALIQIKTKPTRDFLTPKEFAHSTGIPYSSIIFKCKTGKIKARQDDPNCTWQIHIDELKRYHKEADENI